MSSDSEFEEIKINTVKEDLEKKQKEMNNLQKKKEKKKVKTKKNLLQKYKEQIEDNFKLTDANVQLIKTHKKVNEVKKTNKINQLRKVYIKDDFILSVTNKPNIFNSVKEDVTNFKRQHFFGNRLKRENIGKILSKR